jgi:hypothetical protein
VKSELYFKACTCSSTHTSGQVRVCKEIAADGSSCRFTVRLIIGPSCDFCGTAWTTKPPGVGVVRLA